MKRCKHHDKIQPGPDRPYTGPVNSPGVTDENRAAHGNVRYTEQCTACGATRSVNANGGHREYGAWRAVEGDEGARR